MNYYQIRDRHLPPLQSVLLKQKEILTASSLLVRKIAQTDMVILLQNVEIVVRRQKRIRFFFLLFKSPVLHCGDLLSYLFASLSFLIESFSNDEGAKAKTSLLARLRFISNFVANIPIRIKSQMQVTTPKFRERKRNLQCCVYVLHKTQFKGNSRRSGAVTAKKCSSKVAVLLILPIAF